MNDIKLLNKICRDVLNDFEYDIAKLGFEIHERLDEKLKKNGFPIKEYHDKQKIGYNSSPAKILANDAIINSFHNQFIMASVLGLNPEKWERIRKNKKKED